jgi:hypothetical protein
VKGNPYRVFVWKRIEKRPLRRERTKWYDKIKVSL